MLLFCAKCKLETEHEFLDKESKELLEDAKFLAMKAKTSLPKTEPPKIYECIICGQMRTTLRAWLENKPVYHPSNLYDPTTKKVSI